MDTLQSIAKKCCLFGLLFLLAACSKVTQENFDKIKNDMPMQDVIAILGEPANSESIDIGGMSGTSAIWKDKNGEIDIQFLNDKVLVKSYSKSIEEKPQTNTSTGR